MISLSDTRPSLNSVISVGEHIYTLIKKMDLAELDKEIPQYTKTIEQYFLTLDKDSISRKDFEDMQQVMSTHNRIINLIDKEKDTISKNLKQLHAGKEMQNTYPQT